MKEHHHVPVIADKGHSKFEAFWDSLFSALGDVAMWNFKQMLPWQGAKDAYNFIFKEGVLEEKCVPSENKKSDDYFYSYAIDMNPYATQWLITEIRGADYIKLGNKEIGYNVKFSYTEPTLYRWRSPFARPGLESSELPNFRVARNSFTPEGCDSRMYQASFGIKEYVYLKSIETATHKVDFELNEGERVDGKGWEVDEKSRAPIMVKASLAVEIKNKEKIRYKSVPPENNLNGNNNGSPGPVQYSYTLYYWQQEMLWKPKYIYFNNELPQSILEALYDGKFINIRGLGEILPSTYKVELTKRMKNEGVPYYNSKAIQDFLDAELESFLVSDIQKDLSFKVVPNSYQRTSGNESKNGLFRLELESDFISVDLSYLRESVRDSIDNLPDNSLITLGEKGDVTYTPYINLSEILYAEPSNKDIHDNEMRYLTKISYFKKGDTSAYREYRFNYDYSLHPKTLNSYCSGRYPRESEIDDVINSPDSVGVDICEIDSTSNSLYGKLTLRSITEKGCQNGKCATLPPFVFSYNMPAATSTRISSRGGWISYFQENLAQPDDESTTYDELNLDDEYFEAFTDLDATILASSNMVDEYGFWSNSASPENHKINQSFADYGASAWSLNRVVDPAGGHLEVEYERDRYGAGIDYSQDNRIVELYGYGECSSYRNDIPQYASNLCIAVKPLYWREQCLGPRAAYWDSERPKGFFGDEYAYLDSMEIKENSNLFFNLIAQLKTTVDCGVFGLGSCTRHRSVSIVGDGLLLKKITDGDKKLLVVDRSMEELYTAGQNAANKINNESWSFTGGSRNGFVWTGKKLDQVKSGDLRVTRLIRHDIGLKSLTSYEYADGELAQLTDSSYTTVLGNRFFTSKISSVIPDVHLDPISRIVGIDDDDLMYLPGPQISYPKVTVKNSSEDTSVYNGSSEFFYITPESGVPEEFIDPATKALLKPFVKVNIMYVSSDADDDYDDGKVYDISLLDASKNVITGAESKRVLLFPDDRMSLMFYVNDASLAKYVRVSEYNKNNPKTIKLWSSSYNIESLKTPFTKFNEVSVAIFGGSENLLKVTWKRSQKEGFFPILYKQCEYGDAQIDLESAADGEYGDDTTFTINFEENVTYHDLSAFLGQNYKIVTKRGVGSNAVVVRVDSSFYSTEVPDVLNYDIPDADKYKVGRQVEKWSSEQQLQCVDSRNNEDLEGKGYVCKKQAMNLYMRRLSGANIHKEFAYIRYPVFQIGAVTFAGYDNQQVNVDSRKFEKTELHNYAYEALTGAPTATLATMDVDDQKTLRKLTNVTPYYMATNVINKSVKAYFDMADEMFLRNMLTQNYMEEIYTDTLKDVKDSSWETLKTNENLRSFSVSPYRTAPNSLFNGATGTMPILAFGTFQSKAEPSVIRPDAMDYVDGSLEYEDDTLKYNGSFPSLEEYAGTQIVAINSKYKVTETRDVFKRYLTTLFSDDGMYQLGLFFPAKQEEVGAILAYGDASYNSANCTKLNKTASNGEILIGGSKKNVSCNITTDSKNMVMEYRYWTQAGGWVAERRIVSPSKAKLEIPADARLNYFRVYPEGAEAKTFVYDKYGNIIQIVAEDNTSTYYEYDPLGFLVQSRNDDGVSFKAHHREYMNDTSVSNGAKE